MKEYDEINARGRQALMHAGQRQAEERQTKHLAQMEIDQKTLLTFVHQSLESLIDTIKDSDTKSEALGNKMLWLTVVGVILALTQIIPAIDTLNKWFMWW